MINRNRLKELIVNMVDIYSPTAKEADLGNYILEYLNTRGIQAFTQNVEDDRNNVIFQPETPGAGDLLFMGHIDTVAAPDFERYEAEIGPDGDTLSGLGAADMKSGCAAMIEAFITFKEEYGYAPPAALALVVGEEETGDGAARYLEEYRQAWAVVAEPTDLVPCLGHYGYIEALLETLGTRMHASLATKEHNAIHNLLKMLLALTDELDQNKDDIVYNIRDMISSQAGFAVPDRCNAAVDLHLPPHYPIGTILFELEEIADRALQLHHGVGDKAAAGESDSRRPGQHDRAQNPLIQFSTIHSGYRLPDKGLLPELIRAVYEKLKKPYKPADFRSDSDASLLWESGVRPVILGPGTLAVAHTAEEAVSFAQAAESAEIYLELLKLYSRPKSRGEE